jgi:hypothetical protein
MSSLRRKDESRFLSVIDLIHFLETSCLGVDTLLKFIRPTIASQTVFIARNLDRVKGSP